MVACEDYFVPVYTGDLPFVWPQPKDTKQECLQVGKALSNHLMDQGDSQSLGYYDTPARRRSASHPDCFVRRDPFMRCLRVVLRFPDPRPAGGSLPDAKDARCKRGSRSTHGVVHFSIAGQETLLLWV